MPVAAKLEVILKISEFPDDVKTVQNGWKEFHVENNGRLFRITVRPKTFNKLEETKKFPEWVAAIAGQLGPQEGNVFTVVEPNIQVFEKKSKPAPASPPASNDPQTPKP